MERPKFFSKVDKHHGTSSARSSQGIGLLAVEIGGNRSVAPKPAILYPESHLEVARDALRVGVMVAIS